jgi:hypothetical protein
VKRLWKTCFQPAAVRCGWSQKEEAWCGADRIHRLQHKSRIPISEQRYRFWKFCKCDGESLLVSAFLGFGV